MPLATNVLKPRQIGATFYPMVKGWFHPEVVLEPKASTLIAPQQMGDTSERFIYLQVEVPLEWREPVLRHHEHLVELASALQDAGLPQHVVSAQLDQALANYRLALMDAVNKTNRYLNDD